ncbi:MAG TPA: NYN domain-containing protein [Thermoplasmata archaeon]|nr:NYN domain-containing protein [Thermoplasmata archaeon]
MDRPRSVSLIDGGWLEMARQGMVSDAKWNLQSFADRLVPKHHWRFRTYYFDALPYKDRSAPSVRHVQKYREKEEQLQAIDRLERFTVRKGYCKQTTVKGYLKGAGFQQALTEVVTIEQKMVDVLLAVELTRIAWSKEALHIGLVGGDGDYVAAVRAARDAGAIVRLFHIKTRTTAAAPELFDAVDERVDLTSIFQDMEADRPAATKE